MTRNSQLRRLNIALEANGAYHLLMKKIILIQYPSLLLTLSWNLFINLNSFSVSYICSLLEHLSFMKYKTFSVLIYSYINTSGNWKNEKLFCTQFRVFPIFTSIDITVYQYGKNVLYFFYNIAQRTLTKEWREIFRVNIELYQHGS